MLLDTYSAYCQTTEKMINEEIKRIYETIMEYTALKTIRPIIANGISTKLSHENILNEIEKMTDVSKLIAKELINKYKISKLLTLDTDTSELNRKVNELNKILKQIVPYVLEDFDEFVKNR